MMAALPHPPFKTWTRAEIEALEAAGLLAGSHYELIEGEVFDKTGQKPLHASAITRAQRLLEKVFGPGFIRVQAPVEPSGADAPYSLPEPDLGSHARDRSGVPESSSASRRRAPRPGGR